MIVCVGDSGAQQKIAGLRFWRNNQWQNSPTSNSYCKSKTKTRRSGQGAWRGVDEISGMRDGGHTIPVKLLSQSGLSVSPPCSTNSSMGLSRYKRLRLRLTFWTVCTARTGQFKAVDPQYEPKIRGTQSWFNQCHGSTGENVVGSTVVDQSLHLCAAMRCVFLAFE